MRDFSIVSTCSLALSLASGCATPGFYTSPRLLRPGQTELSVSAEIIGSTQRPVDGSQGAGTGFTQLPMPYFHWRYGLSNRFESGLHIGLNSALGFDIKMKLVRSRRFDLATDLSVGMVATNFWSYLHLPLVAGFNLTDSFHVYLGPRISYSNGFNLLGPNEGDWKPSPNVAPHAPNGFSPGGLAALRIDGDGFWVQPEYNILIEQTPGRGYANAFTHHFFAITLGFPLPGGEDVED